MFINFCHLIHWIPYICIEIFSKTTFGHRKQNKKNKTWTCIRTNPFQLFVFLNRRLFPVEHNRCLLQNRFRFSSSRIYSSHLYLRSTIDGRSGQIVPNKRATFDDRRHCCHVTDCSLSMTNSPVCFRSKTALQPRANRYVIHHIVLRVCRITPSFLLYFGVLSWIYRFVLSYDKLLWIIMSGG